MIDEHIPRGVLYDYIDWSRERAPSDREDKDDVFLHNARNYATMDVRDFRQGNEFHIKRNAATRISNRLQTSHSEWKS